MQEELTTDMHYEFMENEVSRTDFYVAAIYGAIRRGVGKDDACRRYGISVEYYDANIRRVLDDPSW